VREGLRYIRDHEVLGRMLSFYVVAGLLAINFPIILPLMAKITFDGNAGTYSVITVAMGVGSLAGALVMAHRGRSSIRLVFFSSMLFGAAILAAALAPSLPVFLFLMTFVGMGMACLMASGNSVVQLTSEPQMRGRVMSVWTIAVLGTTPIGGPFIGWLSSATSPRVSMLVGGTATLVAGGIILGGLVRSRGSSPQTRRVPGILSTPPLASSVTAATGSGSEKSVASV
jgi:MFS family permease